MMPPITTDTDETHFGRMMDWRLLARFLSYAKPYLGQLTLALLLLPAVAVVQLAQPLIIKEVIDNHLSTNTMDGFGGLILLYAGLVLGHFVLGYLQSLTNLVLGQRMVRDLRRDLFAHLLRQDAQFFAHNASGRLTNRLSNDTEAVSQMVSAGLISLAGDVLLLIAIWISMFLLAPQLSLITLLAMPIIALVTMRVAGRLRRVQRTGRLLQSRMAGQIAEEAEGWQVIRLFRRQERNRQIFDKFNQEYFVAADEANRWEGFQFSFVESASTVTAALLLWYGSILQQSPDAATMGTLVAFIDYIRRIFFPIRDLSSKFTTMQAAMTALERIFALLETQPAIQAPHPAQEFPRPRGEIALSGVFFSYGEKMVLEGIDLTVAQGEKIAIVGATGAGKSTLIKLLNRTLDPMEGVVELDGTDLRALPLPLLRKAVGMVQQETFLFAGTIADNIGLGDPTIPMERIHWAATQSGADTFIQLLPDGYATPLVERGGNLSIGQRQLLGIARVLAFDPAILVLDEATSSVDTISERLIQAATARLLAGRTAVIVAHRLSTILDADRIVVLAHGQIQETGTHRQLLAKNGIYAKLYTLQYSGKTAGNG